MAFKHDSIMTPFVQPEEATAADAIAYGIILQAVEIATAIIMGVPALLREGMSWRDVRRRALHAAPVRLVIPESHPAISGGANTQASAVKA